MAQTFDNKVNIEVGITGTGSVKSIKTELREAKEEAIEMARRFGDNSAEATNAAKKVAKLKDEIEDLGLKIKGVNPDKFQRIATLVGGLGNGFAAAQGAMALFGTESEDLAKTMVRLQGAIALSQGLQGLKDLPILFAGIGGSATKAFQAIKLAIGSTGIGLIVVALGAAISALIYYWDDLTGSVDENTKALQANADSMRKSKEVADALAESEAVDEGIRRRRQQHDIEKIYEEYKIRKANMEARVALMKEGLAKELAAQEVGFMSKREQMLNEGVSENLIEALNLKEREDIRKKYADIALQNRIDAAVRAQEAQKKIDENEKKDAADQLKYHKDLEDQAVKDLWDELDKKGVILEAEYEQKKRARDAEKKLNEEKVQMAIDYGTAIGQLTTVFAGENKEAQREAFELNKAISIATAIIKTYEGAATAAATYAEVPVLAAIAAGAQIALGLAQVAQIAAQKFPEDGQSPSTSLSASVGYSAPNINQSVNQQRGVIGNTTGVTGNQTQTNTTKVIVTETDITRVQNRTNDLKRRAIIR